MQKEAPYYKWLLQRYLSAGRETEQEPFTAAEMEELFAYLKTQSADKVLLDSLQAHFVKAAKEEKEVNKDASERMRRRLLQTIASRRKVRDIRHKGRWIWQAAAILTGIFIIAGAYLFYGNNYKHLSSGTAKRYYTISAPAGSSHQATLPDGTKVWLNAGSSLKYPETFDRAVREVMLSGEAYFEAAPVAEKPFIIETGGVVTQVLGTSFNISAYRQYQQIRVTVLTGSVRVSGIEADGAGPQKNTVLLMPNQEAVYDKHNGSLEKVDRFDASLTIAWKKGNFSFRNTPFPEAVAMLERYYNVKISYDKPFETCIVHADFNIHTSVMEVLKLIALSVGGNVQQQPAGHYYLAGSGCR